MKLLWVKSDFLHPTTRGREIRTLETLKRLHQRHEVHYVALSDGDPEGLKRSSEYCTRAYAIPHHVPDKRGLGFAFQLLAGLVSAAPVAVSRYWSPGMQRAIADLIHREHFQCVVCDFLFPAQNLPDPASCVLFQHNVEAVIWKRRAANARNQLERVYLRLQAGRMHAFEGRMCRAFKRVIAVSETDAAIMRREYGVEDVHSAPTGVDVEYFARPAAAPRTSDVVFAGSMDWAPNVEGALWFVREVLPLIRAKKPDCLVTFAGRRPARPILELAANDPRIAATGTVPDIRPYLWGSRVSVVPLFSGSGTRLKIFESFAARLPVVSTTIGAEGLPVEHGQHLYLADHPHDFAARCLELLENPKVHSRLTCAARDLVASRFSWDVAAREFEELLTC